MNILQSDLYKRLKAEVDKISIIDTHEHLQRPSEWGAVEKVDFGRLFFHYAKCDLISAGMNADDMAKVCDPTSDWDVERKWKAIEPWWRLASDTTYCEALRIAMRDLYGVEDLNAQTVGPLSEAMRGKQPVAWTREVFDRAGIEVAQLCAGGPSPSIYSRERYPELFVQDLNEFFTYLDVLPLERESGITVHDLDDYLAVIDWYFEQFADEAVALKIGHAYVRTLNFEPSTRAQAEGLFNRVRAHGQRPGAPELKPLEDYIVHYVLKKCLQYSLPVKIHTGLQEGNGNMLANSRASLLNNIFMKYPKNRFDIFHISWPYTDELAALAKNFQNVWVDFCWAWIISPSAARRALHTMLETVPANKIHGFGGDYIFVEGSYGHAAIARREITRVLAEKVEEGTFGEDRALRLAHMLLRENAATNFRVDEKRKIYARKAAA